MVDHKQIFIRDQMVVDGKDEYDSVVRNKSSSLSIKDSDLSLKISSYYCLPTTVADDQIPLMDWIKSGEIEKQMIVPAHSISMSDESELLLDKNIMPSTPEDYLLFEDKVSIQFFLEKNFKSTTFLFLCHGSDFESIEKIFEINNTIR